MRRRAVALVLLAAAATGCQLRLDVRVALERDGGGTVAVAVAADGALMARAADAGADPLATLRDGVGAAGGWDVGEEALPDGGRRLVATASFDDAEELAGLSAALADGLAAPEVEPPLQPFALEVEEGELRLRGGAGAVPTTAVADLGRTPDALVEELGAQDAVRYGVEVLLPAAALAHDASAAEVQGDGSTLLRWDVPLGTTVPITATGVRPRPPVALYAAAAAGGAVLVLVAALAVRTARRR